MVNEHILSLSYGKDSLACLGAIEKLGWPLDRIIHAEVWATDTIQADLPPMVEFKAKADKIIKERWGIEVEHLCATRNGEKLTYEKLFYHVPKRKAVPRGGGNHRFPIYNRQLVQEAQRRVVSSASPSSRGIGVPAISNGAFSRSSLAQGAKTNIVQYLGIAADEPERIERHNKPGFLLPLVEIGWDEAILPSVVRRKRPPVPYLHHSNEGGVLVLPQSRRRPAPAPAEELPGFVGAYAEMG